MKKKSVRLKINWNTHTHTQDLGWTTESTENEAGKRIMLRKS